MLLRVWYVPSSPHTPVLCPTAVRYLRVQIVD
eukprot:COSAG03_NODE_19432_length_336_cov_2.447257_1_plen_31_part_10